jgi:nucleotidyltransferase/DNA polymerase involved in DNA repair
MTGPSDRYILHVDMDAFYAAIEQLDRPELRGKPILVGGDPHGRGVVATASYEARPYGCRSAMPTARALRLCPAAVVVRPRMERYAEVSKQVFEILEEFTPLMEPVSIDEAFLDVAGSIRLFGPPEQIDHVAQRLRRHGRLARTVTLKIRSADFTTITRSKTLDSATDVTEMLWSSAAELFETWSGGQVAPVRLIGVGVSQLSAEEGQQLALFGEEEVKRHRGLDRAIDQIRERYGKDALSRGGPIADRGRYGP